MQFSITKIYESIVVLANNASATWDIVSPVVYAIIALGVLNFIMKTLLDRQCDRQDLQ